MDEAEQAEIERLKAEQAQLEAEVAELRSHMTADAAREQRRQRHRTRRVVAAALVVVTSLVFTVAATGVWTRRNALNTDRWVTTVTPIAGDPAVQATLGRYVTDQLMTAIDPEAFFESVLPERGQILAGPLTNALRGFVNDKVTEFLASDTFQRLWVEINERAHTRLVDVLEGDLDGQVPGVTVRGDDVVLSVIPLINQVLARIGEESPDLFGHTINLPTITVDEIPKDAIAKLEDALGRPLPDNFGQFTIFDVARLRQAQDGVDLFNRFVVLAVILAVVLFALTLWISPRRRRTLIQLAVGIGLGIVVIRRLAIHFEGDVVQLVKPDNQEATRVITRAFVSSLLDASQWILGIAALVVVVAVLTGPYPWVRALRAHIAAGRGRCSPPAGPGSPATSTTPPPSGSPATARWSRVRPSWWGSSCCGSSTSHGWPSCCSACWWRRWWWAPSASPTRSPAARPTKARKARPRNPRSFRRCRPRRRPPAPRDRRGRRRVSARSPRCWCWAAGERAAGRGTRCGASGLRSTGRPGRGTHRCG